MRIISSVNFIFMSVDWNLIKLYFKQFGASYMLLLSPYLRLFEESSAEVCVWPVMKSSMGLPSSRCGVHVF
jgi:hypothetical protein